MGIEAEEISEGLYGNDGAGDGVILRDRLLHENLQGVPGTAAQVSKKLPVVKEISTQKLRDTEDEMPMGNLLENVHA
jgi:hypothetical protein